MSASRLATIYGQRLPSRIIAKLGNCVAMPTLGQLFKGSSLVLPVEHIETMSEANAETIKNLVKLVSKVIESLKPLGAPLVVEHGAKRHTGSACGVYHAHLHVIPLPTHVALHELLPDDCSYAESLAEAFGSLKCSSNYLVCQDTLGKIGYTEADTHLRREIFTSQYIRRRLAELFELDADWDWRTYRRPEPWVFETLRWFGDTNVLVGQ